MYFRMKLREPKGCVVPKGPSFSSARLIRFDVDGTEIRFRAPKHRPRKVDMAQVLPEKHYQRDNMIFRSYFDEDVNVSDEWKSFKVFFNSWAFYGPWFTGTLAELRMSFYFDQYLPKSEKNISLFHPRVFENAVASYLTNLYSKYISKTGENKLQHYSTPVDWRPIDRLSVPAVCLKVMPSKAAVSRSVFNYLLFAVSDDVLAVIQFLPSQLKALSQEELDKRVSRSTMHELMENIINSFQIELSPEAKAAQKEVLKGLDDTSLVKDFPPLKWGAAENADVSATTKLEQK